MLANRLTEDGNEKVLLLEAGPKDTILGSKWLQWKIHMPAALTYNLCDDKYVSCMYCCYCNTHVIHIQIQLVLPHRAAEECQQPGDVLAAGPRVGRLQQPQRHGVRAGPRRGLQQVGAGGRRGLGVRGRAALLQEGAGEVTTCHVSPDLRLVQTHSCGGNEYRGDTGPLHVTRYEARGQLDQAWLEAGQQAGDCTRGR